MSDVLYIGDIPSDYHYAIFNANYIDLYNTDVLRPNNTYNFYRLYMYDNYFAYDTRTRTLNNYSTIEYLTDVPVSVDVNTRRDAPNIWVMSFIAIFGIVILFNIVTSMIRKGGVLGGLH